MEQGENLMDNNFENFEKQKKYSAINEAMEKQADKYAEVSRKILVAEAVEVSIGILLGQLFDIPLKYIFVAIMLVSVVCHLISLGYAICGYNLKKTKKTKEIIFIHKIVPIVCVFVFLIYFIWVYIAWSLMSGFLPEDIPLF